ncbi:GAF domain-containing protein [Nannocystis pusilla]|uniref:GAF domain-containing protein n=1 Tax=Nannocystis pusilla TaxID=889268 RepID=A0ABS7TQC7_9BACT|nr:GAF domain-containing protein [Nannocystis pusilla]MBZ5710342.1 GAF domain-containing protein [Nannocystis pusilla]
MNLLDRAARIAAAARIAEDPDRARARVLAELMCGGDETSDSTNLARQLRALLELSRDRERPDVDLATALGRITETAVDILKIHRAGVWFFAPDASALECADLYDVATSAHSSGGVLYRCDFPIYFATLATTRVLDAGDARNDPRTREFAEIYFRRHGVAATLDAPIRSRGGLSGVLCCEYMGDPRAWTDDEMAFVASLADAVTLALETDRRRTAERDLLHKMSVIHAQRQEIARLTSPVLEVWDNVLAVPLIGQLDADRQAATIGGLAEAISRQQAAWVILDLQALESLDATNAESVAQIAHAVRRLGAGCVLSGVTPDVVTQLVALSPELGRLPATSSLKCGLQHCLQRSCPEGQLA